MAAVAAIREEEAKIKRANLIEESIIPYSSPVVCVPKPNRALQVSINFFMVNQDIVNNSYPMHRIKEQLEAITRSRVFTTLDITKGYHQLVLQPYS